MYNILPKLTKDYILTRISQIDIWKHYTGFEDILPNKKYNSPFDKDEEEASFIFYGYETKLRGKDFGGDFFGDCFDLVGRLMGLRTNRKNDFTTILHIIARDFKIHQYAEGEQVLDKEIYDAISFISKRIKLDIQIEYRNYTKDDTTWINLRLGANKLKKFGIYPANKIYLNESEYPIYTYDVKDPAYVYIIDPKNKEYKIYFPLREKKNKRKPRFITNTKKIQGLAQIQKAKIGIITKSMKDVVALNNYKIDGKEIQAIAPIAETVIITPSEYEYISKFYDEIYSLYDYDPPGLHMAWLLRKIYGIKPLFLKNPTWNSKIKYPIKDFSDYVNHNTDENVNNLITQTYNLIKNEKTASPTT